VNIGMPLTSLALLEGSGTAAHPVAISGSFDNQVLLPLLLPVKTCHPTYKSIWNCSPQCTLQYNCIGPALSSCA